MSLTYAGVPLLLEDPGHELQAWLQRSLPLEDLRLFGTEPVALREGRHGARGSDSRYSVGLATPNSASGPPRLKINTLWVPTGASRWSQGLFLCSGANLVNITSLLASDGSAPLKLIQEQAGGDVITTLSLQYRKYLLPPRRLAYVIGQQALWLLPLVDKRYFWQWRDFDYQTLDADTTWESLIEYLLTALGLDDDDEDTDTEPSEGSSGYDTIPDAYQAPDAVELTRHHENAAVLLDAVAASVGMRVVFNPASETVTLENAASAAAKHLARVKVNNAVLAGGTAVTLPNYRPSHVKVVFPIYRNGLIDSGGDVYQVTNLAGSGCDSGEDETEDAEEDLLPAATMQTGTTKVFYDTCQADMTGVYPGGEPLNVDLLSELACQIASDYYAWLGLVYDVTVIGIPTWYPSGFDDCLWYHFGSQRTPQPEDESNSGDYACYTRVCTHPYNFGVSELLHWPTPSSSTSISDYHQSTSSGSSGGEGTVVRVVNDICCDGEDIVVCYTDLHFDARGHLGNVDENIDGCDCVG